MYKVIKSEVKNILNGKITKVNYEVRNEKGELYSTLTNKNDAEIVVFGLNNGYEEHILGGFADVTVKRIKEAMSHSNES